MNYTHLIVKWCKFINIWTCNAFCSQYTAQSLLRVLTHPLFTTRYDKYILLRHYIVSICWVIFFICWKGRKPILQSLYPDNWILWPSSAFSQFRTKLSRLFSASRRDISNSCLERYYFKSEHLPRVGLLHLQVKQSSFFTCITLLTWPHPFHNVSCGS